MKSTAHKHALALLMYNNDNAANIGDATGLRGSSTAGSEYFALHTAWPGYAGNQSTSETAYSGYSRQAVARSSSGFTVTNGVVTLASAVSFPAASAGASGTLLFWSLGSASSGTGNLHRMGGIGGVPVPCTMTTGDTITSADLMAASPTASDGDRVVFWANGGSVPAGLTEGTVYYVVSKSGNTFSVESSIGGGAIDITAAGGCFVQRLVPITLAEGVQPVLSTSTRIEDA